MSKIATWDAILDIMGGGGEIPSNTTYCPTKAEVTTKFINMDMTKLEKYSSNQLIETENVVKIFSTLLVKPFHMDPGVVYKYILPDFFSPGRDDSFTIDIHIKADPSSTPKGRIFSMVNSNNSNQILFEGRVLSAGDIVIVYGNGLSATTTLGLNTTPSYGEDMVISIEYEDPKLTISYGGTTKRRINYLYNNKIKVTGVQFGALESGGELVKFEIKYNL